MDRWKTSTGKRIYIFLFFYFWKWDTQYHEWNSGTEVWRKVSEIVHLGKYEFLLSKGHSTNCRRSSLQNLINCIFSFVVMYSFLLLLLYILPGPKLMNGGGGSERACGRQNGRLGRSKGNYLWGHGVKYVALGPHVWHICCKRITVLLFILYSKNASHWCLSVLLHLKLCTIIKIFCKQLCFIGSLCHQILLCNP